MDVDGGVIVNGVSNSKPHAALPDALVSKGFVLLLLHRLKLHNCLISGGFFFSTETNWVLKGSKEKFLTKSRCFN